jgi:hypothetical protein
VIPRTPRLVARRYASRRASPPLRHALIAERQVGRPLKKGDMLVGYRFDLPSNALATFNLELVLRAGAHNSLVMRHMPIAGPIFFQDREQEHWARYSAHCAGCGATSRFYRIKHAGIRRWAHVHRCRERLELRHVIDAGQPEG